MVIGAISFLLVVLVVILDANRAIVILPSSKQIVRNELAAVYGRIPLGTPVDSLEKILDESRLHLLGFEVLINKAQRVYEFRAPVEFPGLTWFWIVYVYTDGRQVIGKAIRPLDGNFYSCNAPGDDGILPDDMKISQNSPCLDY